MNRLLIAVIAVIFLFSALNIATIAEGKKKVNNTKLYAVFDTSMGKIVCELFPKEAPLTVANFTGLAEGKTKWTDPKTKEVVQTPLYSGTIFHRVIPNFMIQGGDPLGLGIGGPGFQFQDEISPDLYFDKVGRLAMANSGPDTNGSQFFITVAKTPWLDGHHTIFGQVIKGQDVVDNISKVQTGENDRPVEAVIINSITITKKL